MSVRAVVSDTIMAIRGKIGQTKVKRYWPGKAPEWWEDDEEEDIWREAVLEKAFHSQGAGGSDIAKKDDDARLHRLAEYRVDNREEIRADHRCIRQVEIVSTIEEEERMEFEEEEEEDALEERRRRIREKNLLRLQEEEEAEEAEAVEEEEESEYETESEEETTTSGIAMVKPAVFVPKSERDTIYEREKREATERVLEELFRKRLEERKLETKQIIVEKIRDEEIIHKKLELEANIAADVDTDDEVNEAEEYEAWKSRERARIKRKEEEDAIFKTVQKEIEMLRNMTEEERKEWERRNPKPSPPQPKKKKRKFMQKYYHKGAFFQSDPDDKARAGTSGIDSIYLRDFSAPTGEDKLDKSILPKVMQVKHFGRTGRTKWTHLVNEDTTDWNNPPIYNDTLLRAKYNAKMACC